MAALVGGNCIEDIGEMDISNELDGTEKIINEGVVL